MPLVLARCSSWNMIHLPSPMSYMISTQLLHLSPWQDVPILTGDISDPASLDAIAARTAVIIALAGPYAKLGTPIVEACIRKGAHYVDLTGTNAVTRHVQHEVRTHSCSPSDCGQAKLSSRSSHKLGTSKG